MKLKIDRTYKKEKYTIGRLYVDGVFFCNTLEDTDRGLDESTTALEIADKKIAGQTAIPTGTYKVAMDIYSPKYGKRDYYKHFCGGYLPRLLNVKGFNGILIHRGVHQDHTEGCILVGWNRVKGQLVDSQKAFEELYAMMKKADEIEIEIC